MLVGNKKYFPGLSVDKAVGQVLMCSGCPVQLINLGAVVAWKAIKMRLQENGKHGMLTMTVSRELEPHRETPTGLSSNHLFLHVSKECKITKF